MVLIQKTNNEQFVITIPKSIVKLKNWKKGTELIVTEDSVGNIVLKEIKLKNRSKKKNARK